MKYLEVISCVEIVYINYQYNTNIVNQFTYRSNGGPTIGMTINQFNNNQGELYRRNPYADTLNKVLHGKNIPDDVRNEILTGYLRGGRRKRRGTRRRTRKNKRKSTRRVRRK